MLAGVCSLESGPGTFAQAVLELRAPLLSPFSSAFSTPVPDPSEIPPQVIAQAQWAIAKRPSEADFPAGKGKILLADDSTSDPASFVTSLLLAETAGESVDSAVSWRKAVELQLDYLMIDAPKVARM